MSYVTTRTREDDGWGHDVDDIVCVCVCVLGDGLISVPDLDPLGLRLQPHTRRIGMARHLGFTAPGHDTVIQGALISETAR